MCRIVTISDYIRECVNLGYALWLVFCAAVAQFPHRRQPEIRQRHALAGVHVGAGQVAVSLERPGFRLARLGQASRDRRALKDHRGRHAPGQE